MSQIIFFRHAQASYLSDDYDQLSPKGEQQARALGAYLVAEHILFDKVYVGPLKRQKHTFEIVADLYARHGLPMPDPAFLPELREHSGPEALRIALPQLINDHPKIREWQAAAQANPALRKRNALLSFQYFMEIWAEGKIEVPGVESWAAFRQNVRKGLHKILAETGRGEQVGAFTSGGTISAISAEALSIADEKRVTAINFSIRNTSFSTFLYARTQFNLLSLNEIPHLPKDLITFV
ncbi:MAG: histidine phosphatase family protein [Bacteroidetes bacterium]|nr:MAG: histidine phosphatase family protein [Bacteroidota bacterium]